MASYSAEWVLFGRTLLERKPLTETSSLAWRPAGIRLDQAGKTYLLDRSHPSELEMTNSFAQSQTTNPPSDPSISPLQLMNMLDTWTYLIEQNRVYPKQVCENQKVNE